MRCNGELAFVFRAFSLSSTLNYVPPACPPPPPCRQIPGYPRIDRENDYLLARMDGAVLDGKPWGRGAQRAGQTLALVPRNSAEAALSHLEVR